MCNYKRGIVEEVDAGTHRVRVRFEDLENLLSPWLDVLVQSSREDKHRGMPKVGNQVACLLDERGASGVVLGATYSAANPPPANADTVRGWEFADGGVALYDEESHVLTIVAEGGVNVTADVVHVDGQVQVKGGAQQVAGANSTDARLDALEQFAATHVHGGVSSGGASTVPAVGAPSGSSVALNDLSSD